MGIDFTKSILTILDAFRSVLLCAGNQTGNINLFSLSVVLLCPPKQGFLLSCFLVSKNNNNQKHILDSKWLVLCLILHTTWVRKEIPIILGLSSTQIITTQHRRLRFFKNYLSPPDIKAEYVLYLYGIKLNLVSLTHAFLREKNLLAISVPLAFVSFSAVSYSTFLSSLCLVSYRQPTALLVSFLTFCCWTNLFN